MLEHVRSASESVFNAPLRLEIAAAIHRLRKEDFTTGELLAALPHPIENSNNVGRNLKKLAAGGVLSNVEGLWHREKSAFWPMCDRWCRELLERTRVSP